MAASGRVCTGFSQPWVATYAENAGTITYTNAQELARGVSVSLEVEAAESNDFYANNGIAESVSGTFSSGTLTLTVDGLLMAARRLIFGLPAADGDGWTSIGDTAVAPYVGVGYIARYMSDGVTTYEATVIPKVKFTYGTEEHATQEEEIEWQTEELTATIYRADDSNHNWKHIGGSEATEAAALAAMKTFLGVTP